MDTCSRLFVVLMNWPFYLYDKDIHLSLVPTLFVLVSILSDSNAVLQLLTCILCPGYMFSSIDFQPLFVFFKVLLLSTV